MSRRTGILLAFVGTILGGLLGPLAYLNNWPATPVFLAAQPASFLVSILLNRGLPRFSRRNIAAGIAVALVSFFYYQSMEHGALGTATLLGQTSILWSELFIVLRGDGRFTRAFWVNTVAVLTGVLLIVSGGLSAAQTTGALYALANGFCYGLWSYYRDEVVKHDDDNASHEIAIGRLHALPLALYYFSRPGNAAYLLDATSLSLALFAGAVAAVNFTCLSQSYRALQLAPSQVLTINTLRVPIATFVGVMFLSDTLTVQIVIGTLLVLAGVVGSIGTRSKSRLVMR